MAESAPEQLRVQSGLHNFLRAFGVHSCYIAQRSSGRIVVVWNDTSRNEFIPHGACSVATGETLIEAFNNAKAGMRLCKRRIWDIEKLACERPSGHGGQCRPP